MRFNASKIISLRATKKTGGFSRKRRSGLSKRTAIGCFPFKISVKLWDLTLHICVMVCCDGWRTNYQSTLRGPRHGKERRWLGKVIRETDERETTQSSVSTERRLDCFNSDSMKVSLIIWPLFWDAF